MAAAAGDEETLSLAVDLLVLTPCTPGGEL